MASDDGESVGGRVPFGRPHYHGDQTRLMFVGGAVLLIVAQSTGATLPFSTTGAVVSAIILVIAAGITTPANSTIHWVNAFLSIGGSLIFGISAIDHYRAGLAVFDSTFIYTEALALLSLMSLYLTTRTIRWKVLSSQ